MMFRLVYICGLCHGCENGSLLPNRYDKILRWSHHASDCFSVERGKITYPNFEVGK